MMNTQAYYVGLAIFGGEKVWQATMGQRSGCWRHRGSVALAFARPPWKRACVAGRILSVATAARPTRPLPTRRWCHSVSAGGSQTGSALDAAGGAASWHSAPTGLGRNGG